MSTGTQAAGASSRARHTGVQQVRVDATQAGRRLDNWLRARWPAVPKSLVYRLIRKGAVRVNGRRASADSRLQDGDEVRLPPVEQPPPDAPVAIPAHWLRLLDEAVLYEDAGMLVVDKPAGLPVHAGSGWSYGLIEAFRRLRGPSSPLELVHRLDRETSGCLILAKDALSLRLLNQMVAGDAVQKRYRALLVGPWKGGARSVRAPLGRESRPRGDQRVSGAPEGKSALTLFRPLRRLRGFSLVEAELGTGRTHQVRLHAAHIGAPVAGDDRYGDRAANRHLRGRGLKRMFLHATRLRLQPWPDRPPVEVEAPLPPELEAVLQNLD